MNNVVNKLDYYVEGRAFEWVMGISMFCAGAEILIWQDTISFGAFQWLLLVMSQQFIGVFMVTVGWLRISGLMLNGQKVAGRPLGPYVRSVCSVLSASMWIQFAIALLFVGFDRGAPSIGLPFWFMFTAGELYVAYATVKNA